MVIFLKILNLKISGNDLLKDELSIDFWVKSNVSSLNRSIFYNLYKNIYMNSGVAFTGVNASGKTTILNMLPLIINLLNGESINKYLDSQTPFQSKNLLKIQYNEIFKAEIIFYSEDNNLNKLVIEIERVEEDHIDKYIIVDEVLYTKPITSIRKKSDIYLFDETNFSMKRDKDELFLNDETSILISKIKSKTYKKIYLQDLSVRTNINIINGLMSEFPNELLSFLDPTIEFLKCTKLEGVKEEKVDFQLKFYGKEIIHLNHPVQLNAYLSSGTIKGLGLFMSSSMVLKQGGYIIVDELEKHFNSEIIATLLRIFLDKETNPNGATIIFSTHFPELLNEFNINDGIYIVRNQSGISIQSLTDLISRNDLKKSEIVSDILLSGVLEGTTPSYDSYQALSKYFKQKINSSVLKSSEESNVDGK